MKREQLTDDKSMWKGPIQIEVKENNKSCLWKKYVVKMRERKTVSRHRDEEIDRDRERDRQADRDRMRDRACDGKIKYIYIKKNCETERNMGY